MFKQHLLLLAPALMAVGVARGDAPFSIVVDPRTGAASLRNDGATPLEIDGYLLRSPGMALNPSGWQSLAGGDSGFEAGPAAANRIGETNLFGALSVSPGQTVPIGSPYTPFRPESVGTPEPAFDFSYSVAGVGAAAGDVEFSRRNTLVLVVDPSTGAATLENQSAFDIDLDGYLITSVTPDGGVLSPAGWQPLQGALGGLGGWVSGASAINRIGEGNLFGSTLLAANGGSLPIGAAINASLLDDETDLRLEFSIAGIGEVQGAVQFLAAAVGGGLIGDYNADGSVDAADYTVWRDNLGQSATALGAGRDPSIVDSLVVAADLTAWKTNFGASAFAAPALSLPATASVPEPSSVLLVVLAAAAGLGFKGFRGGKRCPIQRGTPATR